MSRRTRRSAPYGSETVSLRGAIKPMEELFAELAIDGQKAGGGLRDEKLRQAMTLWLAEQRRQVIEQLRQAIAHRPGLEDHEVRRWVRAVTGQERPLDVAVVKHFLWQVKRKLHGLPVERHLMLVVHGKQNGGKSRAIQELYGPLKELTDFLADLTALGDERQAYRQGQYYITMCDEMGKGERVCMDALKNRITADVLRWRVLGTNMTGSAVNKSTFIGAINPDLRDVLRDPTGMRRFYQMEAVDVLDWKAINSINYAELWCSVDPAAESPIVTVLDELQKAQEDLRAKDAVEEWLDEHCELGKAWTKSGELYDDYCEEAAKQRRQTVGPSLFGRRMKQILTTRIGGEGAGWKVSNGMRFRAEVIGMSAFTDGLLAAIEKNKPAVSPTVNTAAVPGPSPAEEPAGREPEEEMNEEEFMKLLDKD
jgi:predicted P-loop ATPase